MALFARGRALGKFMAAMVRESNGRIVGADVDEYRERRGDSIAEIRRHWAFRGTCPTPPSSSAAITVPLPARYYQIDATAAPGSADGIATFAIVYR
ncbi:hypothetical protein [Burkholderia ubonensis]|uniref:hypothetical protein n=1 Tax=Burkholderia ubonensis TaxID=101571 RepID=UPI000B33E21C|nr:hypothetical protein [Burkholderia ubonensis]